MNVKPIVRWAGGKSWLIPYLGELIPNQFNNYYEPFAGGSSIFLYLKSQGVLDGKAFLSDINHKLINTYKQVKSNKDLLLQDLLKHKNEKSYYYNLRKKKPESEIELASQFLYLNRTSFNGIYRENLKGEYNVPFGNKKYKKLFDFENIHKVSTLLKNTYFSCRSFEQSLEKPCKGDLVFIDPPYTVAHSNNGFVKYNQKIFKWNDQVKLRNLIKELNEKDVYILMTNAHHESILKLYGKALNTIELERLSVIGGKYAKRGKVKELIFTNY